MAMHINGEGKIAFCAVKSQLLALKILWSKIIYRHLILLVTSKLMAFCGNI
jgi:hypothetical protein